MCQWLKFSITDFQEVEEMESMHKLGGKDKITTEPTPETLLPYMLVFSSGKGVDRETCEKLLMVVSFH